MQFADWRYNYKKIYKSINRSKICKELNNNEVIDKVSLRN